MIIWSIIPRDDTESLIRKWSQWQCHRHNYIMNNIFLIKIIWVMVHILVKTSLYDLQNPSWFNVSVKNLEQNDHVKWTGSLICNGIVKVLGKVASMIECPIATNFVDWSLLVIKQDRKRLRLDGITVSAFERVIELIDGYFSPTHTFFTDLISSFINCAAVWIILSFSSLTDSTIFLLFFAMLQLFQFLKCHES